jgi:hypothetical protein
MFLLLATCFLSHFLHHLLKIQYQVCKVQHSELYRNPRYEAKLVFAFCRDLSEKPECKIKKKLHIALVSLRLASQRHKSLS